MVTYHTLKLCMLSQFLAGDEIVKNVSFLQYGSIDIYEYDTSCATASQSYSSIALNYGKIFQPVAMRPLNRSVCFTANCLLGTFGFSAYAGGCFGGSEQSTLSSGSFEVDTCIVAQLTLDSVSHTASFKIKCEQHVEEEVFAGYLPVIVNKFQNSVRKLAFELILGNISAADLTVAVITTLKQSVSLIQRFIAIEPFKGLPRLPDISFASLLPHSFSASLFADLFPLLLACTCSRSTSAALYSSISHAKFVAVRRFPHMQATAVGGLEAYHALNMM